MQTLLQCDLSVIVPVYNLERFLQPLLDSLKAQETGDYRIEYIFVLNNCTDKSEDIIKNSGIDCTILSCTIQGCGPARNMGLDVAKGEYIWFMDGDDWLLTTTAIKDALDKAKSRSYNIVRIPFASNLYRWNYFSMVWQYILRREFVEEFRFPNYQPAEDDAYMKDVLRKAGYDVDSFMMLPRLGEPKYFYNYMREDSNMYRVAFGEEI